MKEPLTNEQVASRAQSWARMHANPNYRDKMDTVLEGLSEADQRRVYLCGQRMAAGLPLKVIPAEPTRKEGQNGNTDKGNKRRKAAVVGGTEAAKAKVSVGTTDNAKKRGVKRSRSGSPK